MRGHRDLRIAAALALVCALLAPLLPVEALSLLFALPLAFFLPGYALAAATFARRPIERPQLLLLSLGLSLCVLALGALLLNYVPGGIGPVSWAILLVLVVLNGCRVAALRRPKARAGGSGPSRPKRRLSATAVGPLLGALLCTTAALAITFTTRAAEHADGYTALWLLPPAPKDATVGGARVGVNSEEQKPAEYRLVVRVAGRDEIIRNFSLDPGETHVLKLGPPEAASASPVAVRALLFRRNKDGDVYRRVSGWLAEPEPSR
ncbi:MAG TPA: DUF1616 domain-containing protein [Solirubrobacterales bacterium]|nr:DUF1616 domain-containing protein [Solirubrobacterales bacterium]